MNEQTSVCWAGYVNCVDNEIKGSWYLSNDIRKEGHVELGKAVQGGAGRQRDHQ